MKVKVISIGQRKAEIVERGEGKSVTKHLLKKKGSWYDSKGKHYEKITAPKSS